MKQKMVLKVTMKDPKDRSKAMKVVAGFPGVLSAALQGDDKGQIAVVGEEVDPVCLTMCLRKKIGYAELVSLGEDKEEKKDKKEEKKDEVKHPICIPPTQFICDVYDSPSQCETCSIM